MFIVRHLNDESAPIEAAGDDDDSSYRDKDEVVHAIMCSNVNCTTYEKEYTFEELQMKEAPSGDWFCPSCSDLDLSEVYVKSGKKVEEEQAEVARWFSTPVEPIDKILLYFADNFPKCSPLIRQSHFNASGRTFNFGYSESSCRYAP